MILKSLNLFALGPTKSNVSINKYTNHILLSFFFGVATIQAATGSSEAAWPAMAVLEVRRRVFWFPNHGVLVRLQS
jgi:hypothetical protein